MYTIALVVAGLVTTIFHPTPAIQTHQRLIDFKHSPYSSGPLTALGLRTGQLRLAPRRWQTTLYENLTCTPAPCVFPNSQASGGGQPANETPIAVNPHKLTNLLSGANDYNCSAIQGYYGSKDGGSTWARTCGTLLSGANGGGGDPIVGYDLQNNAFRGGINLFPNGTWEIAVDKSRDNGVTWSTPVAAITPIFASGLTDKPWMEIDTSPTSRWPNWIYISVTQFDPSSNSQITVSHSTDGGKTWNSPVSVGSHGTYPTVNQFSDLAITKDGTVYATWMRCVGNGVNSNCGGTVAQQMFSKSNDGGNTWSKEKVIHRTTLAPDPCGAFYGCLPNTGERVSNIPVNAVDNSSGPNAGAIYVTDYNYIGGRMKVQVTKSTDGGAHWSRPVGVAPASDKKDQFFPWINVNKSGEVGVTWMDRRNDPANVNYEEFGAASTDGGVTFPNFQLATNPSNPNNDGFGGGFMGDYTGNAWAGEALYASWTDTSNGSSGQDMIGGLLTP